MRSCTSRTAMRPAESSDLASQEPIYVNGETLACTGVCRCRRRSEPYGGGLDTGYAPSPTACLDGRY